MSDKDNELQDEELEDEIIELVDDDGKVINFKLLDVTEYKGEKYTLLLAAEPNDEIAEDEVVIFRLNEKEETLDPIEDENLLQEIFDFYQAESEEDYN
jgi:myo-inositol-hexaphosphate 3-phosphohydrolase